MYKKLVSLFLSIALCMSVLSVTVFAVVQYDVSINGVYFSSDNLTIQCGEGTAQYNPETKELTLTNADINIDTSDSGIASNSELKLILVGENSIVGNTNKLYGIKVNYGSLTITGNGNLDIKVPATDSRGIYVSREYLIIETSGSLEIESNKSCLYSPYYIGILGKGNLNLESTKGDAILSNGEILISGDKDIEIKANIDGIHSDKNIIINGNDNIKITAAKHGIYGMTDIELYNCGSISIDATDGVSSFSGSVKIDDYGSINISAGHTCIFVTKDIIIGGQADITFESPEVGLISSGDITIDGNNNINLKNCHYGIISEEGKISLLGENQISINCLSIGISSTKSIDINQEGNIEINSNNIGIIVEGTDFNISGNGNIEINSKVYGINLGSQTNMTISDTNNLSVNSVAGEAIYFSNIENTISIKGEIGQLLFTTASNPEVILGSINVENPELYEITGSPSESRLVYTMKKYSVSFDMGGHGTNLEDQIVTLNNNVTKPSDPSATGYKFDGWYVDKDYTKAFDFATAITEDITLYAKWTCLHSNTEIKNKKDATTTSTGYTGDTCCTDCGVLVSSGAAIPTLTPSTTVAPTTAPTSAPTAAPELNVGDFINRCYSVALGREADEAGYNYWVDNLNNGQACGAQVGYGFIFSQEYINKNRSDEEFVTDMYAMYFGREADSDGFNYWVGLLESGLTREDIMAGFANSEEFYNLCNKYGVVCGTYLVGVPNDVQGGVNCFVARLYKVCLNRLPDMGGQAGWVLKLMNGDVTGTSCAYGFVFSPEFIGKNPSNEDFVNYMYAAFFGRAADEAGFNAWVDVLNGGGSYEDVFAGFSGSAEFANLCASYGIQA